jgi:cephalosporin hydroxylase
MVIEYTFKDPDCPQYVMPYQMKEEFEALLHMYQELKPTRVLEVGTDQGGTLFQWAKHSQPGALVIACDIKKNRLHENTVKNFDIDFHFLQADSHNPGTLETIKKFSPEYDFIFLDGDHTHKGIEQDFLMYGPLVAKDGLVVFHDILPHLHQGEFCKVDLFWNEYKDKFEYKEFISEPNQCHCGIGVLINVWDVVRNGEIQWM